MTNLAPKLAANTLFDLNDHVALVTGASRGLGQAMCVALAQAGAHVVGVSSGGQTATADQVQACGRQFLPIFADLGLGSAQALTDVVAQAAQWHGRLDVLVNNAGIIRRANALETSVEDWRAVLEVNLQAPFFLAQAAARYMTQQAQGGSIINIASMLSFQGGVRVPAYTAAKSALTGLTKALCNEWASQGVRVNAIAPGYMATDNTAALQADPQRNADILARIPAGRWGQPADLAGAVVFLASQAAHYVHGHTLAVDGGWLAR
jgi:2-dehydro-3-deoxy-D-gluconate 5-dehydrogenase